MNWRKNNWFVILAAVLIVIGIVPRFLWLDRFPAGMSHDELEYILSAKTYYQEGADLSGIKFPMSIFKTNTNGVISFLPAMLMSPIYGRISLSQQNVRLPYVFLNLLTATVLCLLVFELFRKKGIAIVSLIVFLYNPWSFYFSRVASDVPWALFFGSSGLLFLLKQKPRDLFWSWIFFAASFFSYHGAKPVIPLIVIAGLIYRTKFDNNELGIKPTMIYLGLMAIMVGGYYSAIKLSPGSVYNNRQNDIIFLNKSLLADEVNHVRSATIENRLTPMFGNKLMSSINIFYKNYINVFSPNVLFLEGDNRATYRFVVYGLLHKIDIIFLLVGLISIFKSREKSAWLLMVIGILAPVATGLSTVELSVINRSFMLLPVLVILIAYGIYKLGKPVLMLTVIFWIYFLFFYFMQFPKVNQESYFLSERVAANYIARNSDKKIVVLNPEARSMYLETVFYSGSKIYLNISEIAKGNYILGNTKFIDKCPDTVDSETIYVAALSFDKCFINNDLKLSIKEEEFWGPLINLYNDRLCKETGLSPWVTRNIADYKMESMTDISFCKRWIMK